MIDIFTDYVNDPQRSMEIDKSLKSLKPHWCQSIDNTFNISSRTKQPIDSEGTCKPIDQNAMMFCMAGTGQVLF